MERSHLEFLLTPGGQELLREAQSSYDGDNALSVGAALRQRYRAELVAAALTQVDLRRRAVAKFGDCAGEMFFTPAGLEQATHRLVAVHRAGRLATSGGRRLIDLCCGIGSDLMAAASRGLEVTGVDSDPLAAAIASANLAGRGLRGTVEVGAAQQADLAGYDLVFADPARRGPRGRVFDPEAFSPPWSFVQGAVLAGSTATGQRGVAKAAPGIPHGLVPAGAEAEFVSLDGDLREACVWSPGLATASRRATLLRSAVEGPVSMTDHDDPGTAEVRPVGAHIYEPDDAVVRAHLVTGAAALLDGWLLDRHVGYVSSDRRTDTALARGFEVLEVLPYRVRPLRAALRSRGIGRLTVKKRGVAVRPEALVSRLGLVGEEWGTLILSRTPGSAVALLVRPHTSTEPREHPRC